MVGRSLNPFHAIGLFLYPMKSKNHKAFLRHCSSGLEKEGTTELTFTCSNSTIETLEKGVQYVQS